MIHLTIKVMDKKVLLPRAWCLSLLHPLVVLLHQPALTLHTCRPLPHDHPAILQPGFPTTPRQIVVTATVVECTSRPSSITWICAFSKPVSLCPGSSSVYLVPACQPADSPSKTTTQDYTQLLLVSVLSLGPLCTTP